MASYTGDDGANDYDGLKNESNKIDTLGGDDTVVGGYLHDEIDLGSGDDSASGEDGSDTIYTGTGDDTVGGGAGDDLIYSWEGLATDHKLLDGGTGDDIFIAGLGQETFSGSFGEDVVYYITADPMVIDLSTGRGSGGAAEGDRYVMIEDIFSGTGSDRLIGDGAYNLILGSSGNDTIRGGVGGDSLNGGGDIDTLDYRTSDAGVRIDLAKGTASRGDAQGDHFENFENVDGSDFADRLTGDTGANRLRGFDGNDRLTGGDGEDRLSGGSGADRLTGGKDADELRGGTGADRFIFRSTADSGPKTADRDTILDFRHGQHDRIDLSALDANSEASGNQGFTFIGTARFHGASGELHIVDSGKDLLVTGDVNGDKHSDFVITLADLGKLQADDFIL